MNDLNAPLLQNKLSDSTQPGGFFCSCCDYSNEIDLAHWSGLGCSTVGRSVSISDPRQHHWPMGGRLWILWPKHLRINSSSAVVRNCFVSFVCYLNLQGLSWASRSDRSDSRRFFPKHKCCKWGCPRSTLCYITHHRLKVMANYGHVFTGCSPLRHGSWRSTTSRTDRRRTIYLKLVITRRWCGPLRTRLDAASPNVPTGRTNDPGRATIDRWSIRNTSTITSAIIAPCNFSFVASLLPPFTFSFILLW